MSALAIKKRVEATGRRPAAAVELLPEGVLAAALPGRGVAPVYAFAPLAAGALTPSLSETNLHDPHAVAAAMRAALEDAAAKGHIVTLVVPDSAVRVFVLDFDSLPQKPAEAIEVLRFRLRRMVPFDAESAGVSYQVLTETSSECRALVAVIPGPVLAEYELAVRSAGYEPGAVLPSGLAALAAVTGDEPVLAACLGAHSLTTSITRGQDLLLYRTVELPEDSAARLAEVQKDLAVAAAYFEDKLGEKPRQLAYAGPRSAEEFARWISDPSLRVVELTPRPTTGAATTLARLSFAGITGALAGAA